MSDDKPATSKPRSKSGSKRRRSASEGRSRKRRSPKQRPDKAQSEKLLDASSVDTDRPADESLTPNEVADMKRHLRFFQRFRTALRIKLNAHEDLLVNAAREPEHRGRCKHLLAKVDRAAVEGALGREPLCSSFEQRVEFLAGAAAITGDAGVLLTYLESLTSGASRDLAARAFAETVEHIDFEALSAARMARLLDIVEATFDGYAKVQAMFGLLQSHRFRRVFDASVEAFDPALAERFVPLRAVWAMLEKAASGERARGAASRGRRSRHSRPEGSSLEALDAGLRELLDAPPEVLRGYSERMRERLLEVLVTSASDWPYEHPGVRRLLESFADDSPLFRRHAYQCAVGLLSRGHDTDARKLLARVAQAHPRFVEATRLQGWLDKPVLGRFALERAAPKRPPASVRLAYSLERLEPVWLRWAEPGDASRLEREAALHSEIELPGITPCLGFAISDGGVPCVAADGTLPRLLDRVSGRKPPPLGILLGLAQSGLALLRLLAAVGVTLPDARPTRFLVDLDAARPRLELVDLGGAARTDPSEASAAMRPLAADFLQSAFRYPPFEGTQWLQNLPAELRRGLESWTKRPPHLQELAAQVREMAGRLL